MTWLIQRVRTHRAIIIATSFFVFAYVSFAAWNQAHFQTHAYDLGIFSQAVWHLAHFQAPTSTVRDLTNIFGDHWDPILILFAPFVWIFRADWILVIGQAILVALIVPAIFALARQLHINKTSALLLAIGSGLAPGFAPALGYDFHEIAFVAPLIPLLFLFLEQRRWKWFAVILILLLCTKESLGLYVTAAGLGVVLKRQWKIGLTLIAIGIVTSVVLTTLVLPHLNPVEGFRSWDRYDYLASSPTHIPGEFLAHPKKFFGELSSDPAKADFTNYTIIGAGLLPLVGFEIWPLLGLSLLEVLWSKYPAEWSFGFHYPLLPAVAASVAATYGLARLSRIHYWKRYLPAAASVVILGALTVQAITPSFKELGNEEIQQRPIEMWRAGLRLIPSDATVSASDAFVPALSERTIIYRYPRIRAATWIVLDSTAPSFPLSPQQVTREQDKLLTDAQWSRVYVNDTFMIFRRFETTIIPDRPDDPATRH